jgi:hypothetical protein
VDDRGRKLLVYELEDSPVLERCAQPPLKWMGIFILPLLPTLKLEFREGKMILNITSKF